MKYFWMILVLVVVSTAVYFICDALHFSEFAKGSMCGNAGMASLWLTEKIYKEIKSGL